jgi:RNA polymerase sigma-70 factor (ECF subfamily)
VPLEPEAFITHLAQRMPTGRPVLDALLALHAEDLYLACACTLGLPEALSAFERQFLSALPLYVARFNRSPAFADEVAQLLREQQLLARGRTPSIGNYTGRGKLSAWVQVSAIRLANRLQRSERPHGDLSGESVQKKMMGFDPELGLMQNRHREDFRAAFQAALDGLSPEDRLLLRLAFVDGMTLKQIGAPMRLDKSSVSRRLAAIRQRLFGETKSRLCERLKLDSAEFESLMNLIRSQLDVSIERFLKQNASDCL